MQRSQLLATINVTFLALLALGCTHPIEVGGEGEGDIVATVPSRSCTYERGTCAVEVGGTYNESYSSLPRADSSFSHWEGGDYNNLDHLIGSGVGDISQLSIPAVFVEPNWYDTMPAPRAVFVPVADTPKLPDEPFHYANAQLPDHYLNNGFPPQVAFQSAPIDHDSTPADNPITDMGATLGRVLFYDLKPSGSGNTACAGCHASEAFVNVIPNIPRPPTITHAINNGLDA